MRRVRHRPVALWSCCLLRARRIVLVAICIIGLLAFYNGLFGIIPHASAVDSVEDVAAVSREKDEVLSQLRPAFLDKTPNEFVAAVLVFSATRANAIENHLKQLLRLRGSPVAFPIVVSQDGDTSGVAKTIAKYTNDSQRVFHIKHPRPEAPPKLSKGDKNYFFIAKHYRWALDDVFINRGFSHVIVTEDDLDISQDFFSYFTALKPLLNRDRTLWCVSAWNDNGGEHTTDRSDTSRLWRTDFFPGLGWMLTKELWEELKEGWPDRYWDDWMRRPEVRKGRSCIRPEVSRTAHNMQLAGKGSSGGLYKQFLSSIHLPDKPVDFSVIDMSYLEKEPFESQLAGLLRDAKASTIADLPASLSKENSYRVTYSNAREWRKLADRFKLMNDIRSGMVRTAYYGIVPFSVDGTRLFAVPSWLSLDKFGKPGQSPAEAAYNPQWDLQSKFMDFEKMYCKPSRFTGKCDPKSPEMIEWFRRRNMLKKLQAWGEMIVI